MSAVLNNVFYTRQYFQREDICRLCWSKDACNELYSKMSGCILKTPLCFKAENCLSIDLSQFEYNFTKICQYCYDMIDQFHNFKIFCHDSNEKLQKIFEESQSQIEGTPESKVDMPKENDANDDIEQEDIGSIQSEKMDDSTSSEVMSVEYLDLEIFSESMNQSESDENQHHEKKVVNILLEPINEQDTNESNCSETHLNTKTIQNDHKYAKKNKQESADEETSKIIYIDNIRDLTCFGCLKPFKNSGLCRSHEAKFCKALRLGYECSVCNKHLPNRETYAIHMKDHVDTKEVDILIQCSKCVQFLKKDQLSTHLAVHMLVGHCKKNIKNNKSKDRRKALDAINKLKSSLSCYGCNRNFKHTRARLQHEVYICCQLRDGYKCYLCSKNLPSRRILYRHIEKHGSKRGVGAKEELKLKCGKCNSHFKNKMQLIYHTKTTHTKSPCSRCHKQLTNKYYRAKHEKICDGRNDDFEGNQQIYEEHEEDQRNDKVSDVQPENKTQDMTEEDKEHKNDQMNTKHSCDECNCQFSSKSNLQKHLKITHGVVLLECDKKIHTCYGCKKLFQTKNGRDRHEQYLCQYFDRYECKICNKYCLTRQTYDKHEKGHRKNEIIDMHLDQIKCCKCDSRFSSKIEMRRHIEIAHDAEYRCHGCNKQFKNKYIRAKHEKYLCQVLEYGFKCTLCNKYLLTRNTYEEHKKDHKNKQVPNIEPELIKCDKCPGQFIEIKHLRAHYKEAHYKIKIKRERENQCICETCGRIFGTKGMLKIHIDSIHKKIKRYSCAHCEYQSFCKTRFIHHLRIHTGERPFACEFCPYRASSNSNLNMHRARLHSTDQKKAFECTLCGKTFKLKNNLNSHMNFHMETSRFEKVSCPDCGIFLRKKSLRAHMIRKHGASPKGEKTNSKSSTNYN